MPGHIRIERLDEGHDRSLFDCGEEALNAYLKKQASQDVKRYLSTVYIAKPAKHSNLQVIGFYTLSTAQMEASSLPVEIIKKLPRYAYMPAFRIGRLAVHNANQKMGVGKSLLMDALYKCLKSEIPGIAVIVDAKNEQAQSFYQKYGFIQLPQQPLKLFIFMKDIKDLFT